MVQVPDDLLMAYTDGELSPDERAWLETLLSADPNLRERLEPFVMTGAVLPALFAETLTQPLPDRLVETIRHARPQRSASARFFSFFFTPSGRTGLLKRLRAGFRLPFSEAFPVYGSLAMLGAGLVVGWTAGRFQDWGSTADLVRLDSGGVVASGPLRNALESEPSGKVVTGSTSVRPVATLRTAHGQFCRYYVVAPQESVTGKAPAGTACREPGGVWRIMTMKIIEGAGQTPGLMVGQDLATASALDPQQSFNLLNAAEELFLIEKGWPAAVQQP